LEELSERLDPAPLTQEHPVGVLSREGKKSSDRRMLPARILRSWQTKTPSSKRRWTTSRKPGLLVLLDGRVRKALSQRKAVSFASYRAWVPVLDSGKHRAQRCPDDRPELGPVRVGRVGDVPLEQGQPPGVLRGRAHRVPVVCLAGAVGLRAGRRPATLRKIYLSVVSPLPEAP
jgi:hypothetical protein